jgi:hypothetical protein
MTMTRLPCYLVASLLLAPTTATADVVAAESAGSGAPAWSVAVAPRIGVTVPTSSLGAMVVGGLAIDVPLPVANRQLVLAFDLSLTRPSHDGTVMDPRINGSGTFDVAVTELKLGLDLVYRFFGPERSFIPFAGGGPLIHMLRTSETTSFAPGTNTAQSTQLGVEALIGADFRAGPGYVLGEARLVYSGLDHVLTGKTNAGNVMVSAGYRAVF